jgi:uroporphyrinogen decarboxylase
MLLHCDGDLNKLMPELAATGFDWVHPLEARAHNDVCEYKRLYGDRVTLVGNINADVLARGDRAEIEHEIASKIPEAKRNGGYIYNIDHSVPPTISLDTYAYAIDLIRRHGAYQT